MKVKVITLPFDPASGGFDSAELDAFMQENDVIDVRQEFFVFEHTPWLMLVLAHRPLDEGSARSDVTRPGPSRRSGRSNRGKDRPDPAADLDPAARARYERLRAWRNARATQDGVSAFVILTNAQVAAVARAQPGTLTALQTVDGIGQGRIERYGADLLRVLALEEGMPCVRLVAA